jgi:hypothetical protein
MIRVKELGQHFHLATGIYGPVSGQNALFNAEQAESRFRPGYTSLLNAYALHLAKQLGVNVTQSRQLLDLAESYTETFLPGSTDPESTDSESDPEWEVRNIIDGKVQNSKSYFLVDWEPTWMAESELGGSRELINIFREQPPKRG